MKRVTLKILIAAVTAGSVVASSACSADEPGRVPHDTMPAEVTVSSVGRAAATESFPAAVVSEKSAEVATRLSGTVERVLVEVGTRVRSGDPLFALDAADVRAGVTAARSQEEVVERALRRMENLRREGAVSQQELEQASAAFEGARANRIAAEAQEGYTLVRAPFDGVVTGRMVDPGDLAVPGRPLVTMVAPEVLKIVADLPAQRAGTLTAGDPVLVRVAETTYPATVRRVVPALGGGSRTFRVEVTLDERPEGLVAGSYARLEVERVGAGSRWIPVDAVVERGQLTGVFSLESDTVRLRWVRLGQKRADGVELLAGPSGPLRVVRRPALGLVDGGPVAVAREESWSPAVAAVAVAQVAATQVADGHVANGHVANGHVADAGSADVRSARASSERGADR